MTLGQSIRLHRKELELTQEQLGQEIGIRGATVSEWERDNSSPLWANIEELVNIIGIDFLLDALR